MRKLIRTLSFCVLMAFATPGWSQVHLHIKLAPPSLRIEKIPPPVTGQIWVRGYYRFDEAANKYVWMPGHYETPAVAGQVWVEPRYEHHHDYYIFIPGHWK